MNRATVLTVLCIASVGFALPVEEQAPQYIEKRETNYFQATWSSCGVTNEVRITFTLQAAHGALTKNFAIQDAADNTEVATGSIDIADGDLSATSNAITWTATKKAKYQVVATIHGTAVIEPIPIVGVTCYEPHLMTFDGYRYNFHGYCSYTMMKSCDDSVYRSFEVTADFRAKDPNHPYSPPTFMVAFNVIVNGKQLIRLNEDDSILIEGKPLVDSSAVIGTNEGRVEQKNGEATIRLDHLGFTLNWVRRRHGISIGLDDDNLNGKICGLLGNADGNPKNDFIKPDGQRTFISEDFGNSWEIPGSCP